jgi:hypothetical protein
MEPQDPCLKEIPVNKPYNKTFLCFVLSIALIKGNIQVIAAEANVVTNLCTSKGVVFVFFNGVRTTSLQAFVALKEFERLHGNISPSGDNIRYEYFYNYSDGFEDFVETFEQRLSEQEGLLEGRFELFFQALAGNGSWWSTIINTASGAASILGGIVNWYQAHIAEGLTALFANPPTEVNYAEHRLRLENAILEGKKLLLVAHSQGNLFANAAYNFARTKVPAESVKVVHIAPASPSLNGNHVLADLDLVINGLRALGSVASVTDFIHGYLLRPPSSITQERDPLGHGLLEIYINQELDISNRVRAHINDALNTLQAPPAQAEIGFFTATLTWNGSGDVDLHTYEPDGTHVFYAAPQGNAGFLDVDDTIADGPEHYFASCDSNVLQTGIYQIAVANYSQADGREASVQIASSIDGVLGTKSVVLGGATGDTPSALLFNVAVSKDEQTGKLSVSLTP